MNINKEPLISVIVPVYNVEKYLRRCVDSIMNQKYNNLEIILIDDGSTDKSGQICDEYECKDNRIKVFHKKNGGISSARNLGLKNYNGEYVVFVDSDDFLHVEHISYMYDLSCEYNADIVQTEFEIVKSDKPPKQMKDRDCIKILNGNEWVKGFLVHSTVWGKLYKKKCVDDVFFPIGKINEDDGTYYRFIYNSNRICVSRKKLYYYYMSPNSIMRNDKINMDFIDIYEERVRFFKEKNDKYLLGKSYARYAVVLILKYAKFINIDNCEETISLIMDKYDLVYNEGIKFADIRTWILMNMFKYIPNITARIVKMLGR